MFSSVEIYWHGISIPGTHDGRGIEISHRLKIAAAFTVTLLSILGISVWFIYFRYPDTVPFGQNPVLILPLYDFSDNDYIQGFGQISPDYYHNGFDFGVNDTTVIVSPCNAYAFDVKSN